MSFTHLDGVHVVSAHRRRLHAPANYLATRIYDGHEAGDTAYKGYWRDCLFKGYDLCSSWLRMRSNLTIKKMCLANDKGHGAFEKKSSKEMPRGQRL